MEVESARMNESYQCCNAGWMSDPAVGYPMTEAHPSCGNAAAIHYYYSATPPDTYAAYCVTDINQVSVADTMVFYIHV